MSAHILITRVLCCRMAAALLCYWLCSASLSHPCLCGVTLDLRLGFRPRRASRTTANRCKGRTGSPTRSSRWARRFLPWCLPEKVCPGVWGEPAERRGVCNGVRLQLHSILSYECTACSLTIRENLFSVITKLRFHDEVLSELWRANI